MAVSVVIVGARDASLEALVRGCGAPASTSSVPDLSAVATGAGRAPDVVLLDLRGTPHVPAALAAFTKQHAAIGVVVLASALDPALMLEAMRAGITECVAEPLAQEELTGAMARVVGNRESAEPGAVFAFVGARGGVGATTTAVNVATSLGGRAPAATLLIDLQAVHGDAAIFLGAEARYSLLDAVENLHRLDATFFRSLVAATSCGLDLLASSSRMAVAPPAAADLRSVIAFASRQYRYTVLDVPRADAVALDALDQAATIVVVANQELATVRNAGRIAAALRVRYPAARVMTVLNRLDVRADIDQHDVERAVGGAIVHQLPSDYRRAVHAMNTGRPLALDHQGTLSASFGALAQDLAGLTAAKPARRAAGLMGLLARRA